MLTWLISCAIGALTKRKPRDPAEEMNRAALDDLIEAVSAEGSGRVVAPDAEGRGRVAAPDAEGSGRVVAPDAEGNGFEKIDYDEKGLREVLTPAFDFVNGRFDCGDFWYLRLLKLKLSAPGLLTPYPDLSAEFDRAILSFKFWITSPGRDSVCYYSENHQCAFIVCEYLAGSLYPDRVFTIDGKRGEEHMEIAAARFNSWYDLRMKYGFSEFYSCNYLPIDLGALALLIEHAADEALTEKAGALCTEILKLYAEAVFEASFVNASARDYPRNLVNSSSDEPNSAVILETVFGDPEKALSYKHSTARFFAETVLKSKKYAVPEEILQTRLQTELETKRGMGLDLKDYAWEGLLGLDDRALMMQLGSGALTNPEVIENTLEMMHRYRLYHSDFLGWIRFLTVPSLQLPGLLPRWSGFVNYFQNGMALQKGNVYTYRNEHYKVSCLQGYHPGSSGAQKNTMAVTLPGGVTVFVNHPLRSPADAKCSFRRSPSYFGGYGIAPCAAAEKNVLMMIYRIPHRKPAFAPAPMQSFTHAFFPTELFDEAEVRGPYAFARVGGTYLAIIGREALSLQCCSPRVFSALSGRLQDPERPCDLIQKGRDSYWILELSSEEQESFEAFRARIMENAVRLEGDTVSYETCGGGMNSKHSYCLTYSAAFSIDGVRIGLDYLPGGGEVS